MRTAMSRLSLAFFIYARESRRERDSRSELKSIN